MFEGLLTLDVVATICIVIAVMAIASVVTLFILLWRDRL